MQLIKRERVLSSSAWDFSMSMIIKPVIITMIYCNQYLSVTPNTSFYHNPRHLDFVLALCLSWCWKCKIVNNWKRSSVVKSRTVSFPNTNYRNCNGPKINNQIYFMKVFWNVNINYIIILQWSSSISVILQKHFTKEIHKKQIFMNTTLYCKAKSMEKSREKRKTISRHLNCLYLLHILHLFISHLYRL